MGAVSWVSTPSRAPRPSRSSRSSGGAISARTASSRAWTWASAAGPGSTPLPSAPLGKIGGQYVTSQFVSIEAQQNGYAEGILLDERGHVCEGAGENIFAVIDGEIVTPSLAGSILGGITRDSVITLARDLGMTVTFAPISRDMLYLAEELFMTGTAAEVTPLRSVDRIPVGNGGRGPITKALQDAFFGIVEGTSEDTHGWLTPVPRFESVPAAG